jgi:hypothetical protein
VLLEAGFSPDEVAGLIDAGAVATAGTAAPGQSFLAQ